MIEQLNDHRVCSLPEAHTIIPNSSPDQLPLNSYKRYTFHAEIGKLPVVRSPEKIRPAYSLKDLPMRHSGKCFALILLFTLVTLPLQAAEHTKDSLETVKKNLKDKKAVLLDVRELAEWNKGHLKGAILVPLSKLKQGVDKKWLEKKIPAHKIVYTHCAHGFRALAAGDFLKKQGYNVRALKQGYQELLDGPFEQAEK